MTISVNGATVLDGSFTMPRIGAWTAVVQVDATEPPADRVVVASYDGAFSLVGTVLHGDTYSDTTHVRLVGGAGGMQKPVAARGYQSIPARIVVADILSEVGETLSPTAEGLDVILPHYARRATTADRALQQVLSLLGVSWRILGDGTVWTGTDTFREATQENAVVLDQNEGEQWIELGVDTPALLPATTFEGKKVQAVVHRIVGAGVRTRLMFGETDKQRSLWRAIVLKSLPEIDHQAWYPSTVVAQRPDGSVDVMPEASHVPPLPGVELEYPVPGMTAKVAPGARVMVHFEDGNPSKPKASLFSGGTLLQLKLEPSLSAEINSLSVQLGGPSALPLAHAIETIAMFAVLSAAQAVAAGKISGKPPGGTPTWADLAEIFGGENAAVVSGLAGSVATLPTIQTRAS